MVFVNVGVKELDDLVADGNGKFDARNGV